MKRHQVRPRPLGLMHLTGQPSRPRTCFHVAECGWECTCVRTTRGVQSNHPAQEGTKLSAYLTFNVTTYKAPEIKPGRGPDSDLPILRSQIPGYTARPLRPLASEQCSYRPARWSGWRWTCPRQAQTLGSHCQRRLPLSYGGKNREEEIQLFWCCNG